MEPVRIHLLLGDILCVWAYVGQRRLEQLIADFGDRIEIETRFISVFPDARAKISAGWKDRGGFEGFNAHLSELAQKFPHVDIHPRLWLETRPRTSASGHLFVKSVELIERETHGDGLGDIPYLDRPSSRVAWALRQAFFRDNRDASEREVHDDIAKELGLDPASVQAKIDTGEALAVLAGDYDHYQKEGITGSPTFVMNSGRQRLFGNVGYRLLEANVQELLHHGSPEEASWC